MDNKEDIEVVLMPLDEITQLISNGAIIHSLIIVAFIPIFPGGSER